MEDERPFYLKPSFYLPIIIIGWFILFWIIFYELRLIGHTILLLLIASMIAYAFTPIVKKLAQFLPRPFAIVIVYTIFFTILSLLVLLVINSAIAQFISLTHNIGKIYPSFQTESLFSRLEPLGVTKIQIQNVRNQFFGQIESATQTIVPFISSLFSIILDIILIVVMSIYLVIDGRHIKDWMITNSPLRMKKRLNFFMRTTEQVIGGYVRGQIIMSTLVGLLVGIGMFALQVPYALLLGVLAFILSFIPVLGTFVSGAVCVALGLLHGWITAVFVLAYFIFVHIIEGDVVGPRIVGAAVGLHPVISLLALIAGSELYGIWGALFASPVAGIIQAVCISFWKEWKITHQHEFAPEKAPQ